MRRSTGADAASDTSSLPGTLGSAGTRTQKIQPESLRCVWTSDPTNSFTCWSSIPEDVVIAAWRRELAVGPPADRFFELSWQEDVWLAYGLKTGAVRGVHCSQHRTEREERTSVADSRVGAPGAGAHPLYVIARDGRAKTP